MTAQDTDVDAPPDDAETLHACNLPFSRTAVLQALLCSMLWGGNSVAVKLAGTAFPPLLMAALRFALGCLGIGVWAAVRRVRLRLRREQIPLVAANGVLLFIQIGLFNIGTAHSTSIHSVVLINTFPFFTAFVAHYWLPEFSLTPRKMLGLAVAFAGVVTMFANQVVLPDRSQLWGDLALVASAAVLGFKLTYVKMLLSRIDAAQIVFWEAAVSVPLFLSSSLWWEGQASYGYAGPAFVAVLYQGWAVSAIAFVLWTILLGRHSPNELSAFSFTTPLFGMVFGWLVLGEAVTVFLLLGGLLIAAGIYLVSTR